MTVPSGFCSEWVSCGDRHRIYLFARCGFLRRRDRKVAKSVAQACDDYASKDARVVSIMLDDRNGEIYNVSVATTKVADIDADIAKSIATKSHFYRDDLGVICVNVEIEVFPVSKDWGSESYCQTMYLAECHFNRDKMPPRESAFESSP